MIDSDRKFFGDSFSIMGICRRRLTQLDKLLQCIQGTLEAQYSLPKLETGTHRHGHALSFLCLLQAANASIMTLPPECN